MTSRDEGRKDKDTETEKVSDNPKESKDEVTDKPSDAPVQEEVVLREEDVGITGYISQLNGFNGVIKQRYTEN